MTHRIHSSLGGRWFACDGSLLLHGTRNRHLRQTAFSSLRPSGQVSLDRLALVLVRTLLVRARPHPDVGRDSGASHRMDSFLEEGPSAHSAFPLHGGVHRARHLTWESSIAFMTSDHSLYKEEESEIACNPSATVPLILLHPSSSALTLPDSSRSRCKEPVSLKTSISRCGPCQLSILYTVRTATKSTRRRQSARWRQSVVGDFRATRSRDPPRTSTPTSPRPFAPLRCTLFGDGRDPGE